MPLIETQERRFISAVFYYYAEKIHTDFLKILLGLIRESDPFYAGAEVSSPLHSQRLQNAFRYQHNNIFSTLLAFKYDTSALEELVKEGVVDILTTRVIRWLIFFFFWFPVFIVD